MADRDVRVRAVRRAGVGVAIVAVAALATACIPPSTPSTTTTSTSTSTTTSSTTTTTTALATVSGVVFTDDVADGDRDAGDAGLAGWTVAAYPVIDGVAASAPAAATTTGSNGAYSLAVAPGDYVVCETLPAFVNTLDEWHQSAPGDPACETVGGVAPAGHVVTVTSAPLIADFANYQNYAVAYRFGNDADGNGVNDGTGPRPLGQFVDLYRDVDADGVVDPGEPLAYSQEANGAVSDFYSYAGLQNPGIRPGRYVACQREYVGTSQSAPENQICSEVSFLAGGFPLIATSGGGSSDKVFLSGVSNRTISGAVYVDTYAVRARDSSAPVTAYGASSGTTVEAWIDVDHNGVLDLDHDDLMQSTTTSSLGLYSFTLPTADYVVCVVLPTGTGLNQWHQSSPANSACGAIAGRAPAGFAAPIGNSTSLVFYIYRNAGQIFRIGADADLDEVNDGLAYQTGWTVDLYEDPDADGVVAAGAAPAYSQAASGGTTPFLSLASFTNPGFLPGRYVACERSRPGYTQTLPNNSACAAVSAQPGGFVVVAASGSFGSSSTFLNAPPT